MTSAEDKKEDATLPEVQEANVGTSDEIRQTFNYTPKQESRLLTKIDLNLLIILGFLYSFALIDRSNLSNANVSGMNEDLELAGTNRYSIISLIFFIPYILVELPCNMLIRKVRPRWVLSSIGVAWGVIMIGMGFVTVWWELVVLRIFLGAFEGGFFPACVFLIQSWYKRREVQKRMAGFYMVSVCASGFSNILAWGLTTLHGTHGIEGWRWIFIIEGVITVGIGFACLIFVQDFPDRKSRFLTEHESAFIINRIQEDRGDAKADSMSFKHLMSHLLDYKIWMYGLMYMGNTSATYALGYFLPLVLNGMGFNVRDSQLLSAPPYLFAVMTAFTISYFSDKYWLRAPFIILQACMVIFGILLTAYAKQNGVRYLGAFFNCAGANGLIPSLLAYNANNVCSYSKRATSSAMMISFGAVGGIYATTVYREQDRPGYIPGTWAVIACMLMIITFTIYLTLHFRRQNRRMDEGEITELEGQEGFRYTI